MRTTSSDKAAGRDAALPDRAADAEAGALAMRIARVVALHPSQRQAAAAAGISLSQLKRWMSGSNEPTVGPLGRLAASAEVDMNWLVLGAGQMRSGAAPVNLERLRAAIEEVEGQLASCDRSLDASAKSILVATLYEIGLKGARRK